MVEQKTSDKVTPGKTTKTRSGPLFFVRRFIINKPAQPNWPEVKSDPRKIGQNSGGEGTGSHLRFSMKPVGMFSHLRRSDRESFYDENVILGRKKGGGEPNL